MRQQSMKMISLLKKFAGIFINQKIFTKCLWEKLLISGLKTDLRNTIPDSPRLGEACKSTNLCIGLITDDIMRMDATFSEVYITNQST